MRELVKIFVEEQIKRLQAEGDCLEIGSYDVNGNLRDLLAHTNYVGVDLREGPNVDQIADGNNLPFPDNSFDMVVCVDTLEHDRYFWKTISESQRVLKPNGVIILTVPGIRFNKHEYPFDYWRFTKEGVASLIEDWCCDVVSKSQNKALFVAVAGRKI